jgi:lysylphosphatidylglycerol synthetase-like protein (DUF2156 family)
MGNPLMMDTPSSNRPRLHTVAMRRSPSPRGFRRVRRWAAFALVLTGVLSLVSATTPPLRSRIQSLDRFFPLEVPQIATALVAVSGLALLLLSRGIRRGQRLAWLVSMVLLVATAALHLIKGVDAEESIVALLAAAYLAHNRGAFAAAGDRPSRVRGVLTALGGAAVAVAAATVTVEFHYRKRHIAWTHALWVSMERLVGVRSTPLVAGRLRLYNTFISWALTAVGISLLVYALWLIFRPVVLLHRPQAGDFTRAREVVREYGGDTLAYFALRDDKRWFFEGSSVVAYAVIGGICLVSPDPVGPAEEREAVWKAFHAFADEHGWPVAVLGASEEWLPVYRAAGMRDLYVGDEAIVDCSTFSLEGGHFKALRQAVNRIARNGYRMEFYDPARVGPDLRAALRRVIAANRRGDAERGFSMTLGRMFDPDDQGLLLAVAYGPDGEPAAMCHYVPAPGINGYSLDLMRRTEGPHPNGLIDFVVVETIREMNRRGLQGLGLNFATLRAVLAGERGEGVGRRLERWLLRRLSDSMQIESLWKYNAKFGPRWKARYAVYDAAEHMLPAALAVARAESFFELPIIGRFLTPEGEVATQDEGTPLGAEPAPSSPESPRP